MKKLIPGWIHQPGWHCASTAISDVMTFRGLSMSEAMCFGLGSGLGFAFFEGDVFNPTRMTAVRSRNLEVNFFDCMGLPCRWITPASPDEALQQSIRYSDQDVPLLMKADIFHLDYYNSKSHFPGHVICMWGYDDENEEIYVADTERPGLQLVPYSSIKKARFTKLAWYQVQGDNMPIDYDIPEPDWSPVIKKALLKQATDLFKPEFAQFGPFMGFPGMTRAVERLPAWSEAKDWQWSARWFYQVIEKRGTGGGAFRKLYAHFLEEAAGLDPKLGESAPAKNMFEIADRWTALSDFLKDISEKEKPEGLEEASRMLGEILDREKTFFSRIEVDFQ